MTRIRLVEGVYALCLGGSEVLAHQIVRALQHSGRYVGMMYAIAAAAGPAALMLIPGLEAEGISYQVCERRRRFDPGLVVRLAKQMRQDRVQVVHTHHLGQLLYIGVAAKLAGARVVHTEHEHFSTASRRLRRLLRALSVVADRVTAVSDPVREYLRDQVGIPSTKLVTITNGVDIPTFASAKPIDRSELGWAKDDVIIACVARLEPEKAHDTLIEAFRRLNGRHPNAQLLIVGSGSRGTELQNCVQKLELSKSVRFVGSRNDVPRWLAACDVFALASTREGMPLAILEAMAASKPVVATAVGSIPCVVQHGKTGLLVPSGSAEEFEAALELLVSDTQKRQEFGASGYQLIEAHYSIDRTVDRYRTEFEAVLNRS